MWNMLNKLLGKKLMRIKVMNVMMSISFIKKLMKELE